MKYYHIIVTTQNGELTIQEPCKSMLINVVERVCCRKAWTYCCANAFLNHLHVLVGLPSEYWVSKFVQKLKPITIGRLSSSLDFHDLRGWSPGYTYFNLPEENLDYMSEIIAHQSEYHLEKSFEEELKDFSTKYNKEIKTRDKNVRKVKTFSTYSITMFSGIKL